MSEYLSKQTIKIPVFSSEIKEINTGELFNTPIDFNSLIKKIKTNIDEFNDQNTTISRKRGSKVKKMEISEIKYIDSTFDKIPTLLLKITAYNTNLLDGFVEIGEKKNLKKNDKVGSNTNYVLIFPSINGNNSAKRTYQYKFFIYDDPTKESHEIISICKTVASKILGVTIKNLKLDNIIEEIRENKIIENFEIHLSSQTEDYENDEIELKSYLVKSKVLKNTKNVYSNVPNEQIVNTLHRFGKKLNFNFTRIIFKIFKCKIEYRITQEKHKADLNRINNTIEEIFNSQYELNTSDLDKLFNEEFILSNLNLALKDFYMQNN
jgi:hypothetical protein